MITIYFYVDAAGKRQCGLQRQSILEGDEVYDELVQKIYVWKIWQ